VFSGPLRQILSFVYGHDGKLAPNLVLGSDFEHPCHILHTRVQSSFDDNFVEGEVDSIEMKPFFSQPQHHGRAPWLKPVQNPIAIRHVIRTDDRGVETDAIGEVKNLLNRFRGGGAHSEIGSQSLRNCFPQYRRNVAATNCNDTIAQCLCELDAQETKSSDPDNRYRLAFLKVDLENPAPDSCTGTH
jgi:hypothetical protein